jgi:hypothetical protein
MGLRGALRKLGPLGTALTVGQLALVLRQHWLTIPAEHRDRLADLLRKSKGNPSKLSGAERRELRELVRRLDLTRLMRDGARSAAALGQIRRQSH